MSEANTFTHRYTAELAGEIEQKWQAFWEENRTFHAPNPGEPGFDASRPKKFVMDMFPYPSGVGLHVGHPLGFIATDIFARFLRMTGHNVVHPMGFDAFGLPAEQYAIQTGQHPRVTTESNIANMKVQMRRLGLAHDPDRTVATTDVSFYRWTQWIFLRIFNSWYDPEANQARPIEELEAKLAAGSESPHPSGKPWSELSWTERRVVIDDHRLAYIAEIPVNWCPELGTVLANEEVTAEGKSERGNHAVYKRPLKQWMMRITAYCQRLLEDLEELDWPEPIKLMQRNWIGRSVGAEVDFLALTAGSDADLWFAGRRDSEWATAKPPEENVIRVFTTRPDTLYGATYMVLAPEHELVDSLVPEAWPEGTPQAWKGKFPRADTSASPAVAVAAYRRYAESRSDVDRQVESLEKTGVFTGSYAANPVNGESVPVFIADYVLMGYGTGAIMAVPAHDTRDFEFATQFELPIREVVANPDGGGEPLTAAFSGIGTAVNSGIIDGLPTLDAKTKITAWLEEHSLGSGTVNYRLRDWLFSRQRYWGEPFPILFDDTGLPVAVDYAQLPVELPAVDDYTPDTSDDPDTPPTPPLGRAKEWATVEVGGKTYHRELNTMPNWAGSCWYYLRYLDAANDDALVDPAVEKYWMKNPGAIGGVDLYVGGVEHAVLHLLYSRFWHKVLFDLGVVSTPEPFQRLFNQGYVQAAAFTDERGVYVEASEVTEENGEFFHKGRLVTREYGKMGKSLKNTVAPDEMCAEYGADTLRLYEMYMGPLDASKPWNTRDIIGSFRFLQRVWRNLVDEETSQLRVTDDAPPDELRKALHKTIDGVHRDMTTLGFNTAIAKLIEFNNKLTGLDNIPREIAEPLVKMLAPIAPHVGEELWQKLGHDETVTFASYPEADKSLLIEDTIEIPVMVKGRVRARIVVAADADAATMEKTALADAKVQEFLAGKAPKKVIAVPGRMVNLVV
jgi:leucyl-tRNA synthetase